MTTSDQINELATALAKAQGVMDCAAKGSVNPHFKSRYADLASVWIACRGPLAANGLAVIQGVATDANHVTVTTRLAHASGQWIESVAAADARDAGPQSIGSVVTYLRRYALSAMVGVAPDDDDGNEGQPQHATNGHAHRVTEQPRRASQVAAPPTSEQWREFQAELKELVAKHRDRWPDDEAVKADIAQHANALGLSTRTLSVDAARTDLEAIYTRLLDSVTIAEARPF